MRWNQTDSTFDQEKTFLDLFNLQVERYPLATALFYNNHSFTYLALSEKSSRLAHHLIEQGIGVGDSVGIAIPRSFDMVVALLATMKAGGVYVPLDPSHPAERLALMIEDADVKLVLSVTEAANHLSVQQTKIAYVDEIELGRYPKLSPEIKLNTRDTFLISFTSGSTGRPKGVQAHHLAYLNRFHWFWETYPFEPNEIFCHKTTLNFVDHVAELWAPLLKGHGVVLASDAVVKDGFQFVDLLEKHQIQRVTMVPSYLKVLLDIHDGLAVRLPHLKYLTVSGEKLSRSLADRVKAALPDCILLNLYGMSEAAADATYFDSRWPFESDSYPIGRPINNTHIYLLDDEMNPVPTGDVGEMFVAGHGLSKGYYGRDDLTSERFLPNPFTDTPHPLIYKTGDLGRWLPSGVLDFVGRVDNQVKIRGVRIELEEVEDGLRTLNNVQDAVVTAQPIDEENQLIAYVIAEVDSGDVSANWIIEALSQKLPHYMLPARVMLLDAFPLTPNGKIDRKALGATKQTRPQLETFFTQPRTQLEKGVASVWENLLRIEGIGADDDFFDLGGDSLLVVRLRSELSSRFDVSLAAHDLFECRTVRTLAGRIEEMQSGGIPLAVEAMPSPSTKKAGEAASTDIAIIGLAGRFPGAENIDRFWHNLIHGIEGVRRLTEEELRVGELDYETKKLDPDYVPVAGLLEDIELFDADFFNIHPLEARSLDPQQRLWFETAWATLENAGYSPAKETRPIGVFAGSYMNGYMLHNLLPNREAIEQFVRVQDPEAFMHMLNNEKDYMPTKTSYLFNLTGPSINVQTACSTSLVAISLACQSIQNGDCDMALAGGVSIFLPDKQGYFYQQGGIRAKDGHCKPFDADASGTIFSSGLGCVMLKRLDMAIEDNDHILAVVKGSAMNNDGTNKASYTAPSIEGQVDVIRKAQARAGIDVETIGYIEAHGTATPLGDPIEVAALTKAFTTQTDKKQFSAIGSVKSNIGHLDAAAGAAGFIKAVLALKHELIPPTLHFSEPNPAIDFENSPFFVNNRALPWPKTDQPRRAGVSSFGIGGTNAHIVLEEAPEPAPSGESRPKQLLLLSAKTDSALGQKRLDLADYLEAHAPSLADAAFTLVMGRSDFAFRHAIVADLSLIHI